MLIVALAQLFHSGFSSYEFHQLKKQLAAGSSVAIDQISLPKDIRLEVLSGLILFTFSVFMSFGKLTYLPLSGKPVLLSQHEYLKEIDMNRATMTNNLIGSDPYGEITYTPNFVDVHAKRKELKQWLNDRESHDKVN